MRDLPSRPPLGKRTAVLAAIAAAALLAAMSLGLFESGALPGSSGLTIAANFFSRALTPALAYETIPPPGTRPLLLKALIAAADTAVFAASAMSIAIPAGLLLGILASSVWWIPDPGGHASPMARLLARSVFPLLWSATRLFIGFVRSIHELLWAVLFLAAFGLGSFAAILAIAIPYSGILAKVFSEMIDEAPRGPGRALQASGAGAAQAFLFGYLPRALPDMSAYAFYRFECALRSSAILGFFGFPTLGYFIAASFENLHYGEVWTYLYTLFFLIAAADWWSGALRRDFAA